MKKSLLHRACAAFAGSVLVATTALAANAFQKYVALGDSITAGYQAGCLVMRHQDRSYPSVLAGQIGIADFEQPLFAEGPLSNNPAIEKCLGFVVVGNSIGVGAVSDQLGPTNLALPRPYDNLGIPGAASFDLVDLTVADPNANPYAAAILRNGSAGSPLYGLSPVQQADLLSPDLVTLWIGANDILGAVLDGIQVDGVNTTPLDVFQAKYAEVVNGLTAAGRTLVILNVPDLRVIPFATTIPPVVLDPNTNQPVLGPDGNPIPLLGPGNATYPCPAGVAACPLPAGTLVTLGAESPQAALGGQSLLGLGFGIPCAVAPLPMCGNPLPDGTFIPPMTIAPGVLLYPDEVSAISQRVSDINTFIASTASSAGAILVDAFTFLDQVKANGYTIGGVTVETTFATGGAFSADGFHPSGISHTIVADQIIQAINAAKGLSIPRPDFSGVLFTPDLPPQAVGAGIGNPETLWDGRQLLELFDRSSMRLDGFELFDGPHRPRGGVTIVVGPRSGGDEASADRSH